MIIARASLLVILLTTFNGLALADSAPLDPQTAVGGVRCGGGGSPITSSSDGFRSVGYAFSFQANAAGGGSFGCPEGNAFINGSGSDWTSLEIRTASVPGTPFAFYTCAPDDFLPAFTGCTVTENRAHTQITFDFFDSTSTRPSSPGFSGIPNGATFEVDLGESGWTPRQTFYAHASPTPEPGTMALLFTGLTALVARRRKS